jgi:hypothetical protein
MLSMMVISDGFYFPYAWNTNNNKNKDNNRWQQFSWFPFGSKGGSGEQPQPSSSSLSFVRPGDTIAVIGASGNVGKLVALRLSETYRIHGIVRTTETETSLREFLQMNENNKKKNNHIQLFTVDLIQDAMNNQPSENLIAALSKANAIVICTGTTAFPTQAWTSSSSSSNASNSITKEVLSALFQARGNIQNAISILDEKGFNTPYNIDARANQFLIETYLRVCQVPLTQKRRVIMLSSIGVQRRNQMPFPMLNACGVLDAKNMGETAIIENAKQPNDEGYSYTIIRPGQLFGGPYTNNYYLGTLFQLDKESTGDIVVQTGDTLVGDTLRSTLAEITAQILETNTALDTDFSVINVVPGETPSIETLRTRLESLIKK